MRGQRHFPDCRSHSGLPRPPRDAFTSGHSTGSVRPVNRSWRRGLDGRLRTRPVHWRWRHRAEIPWIGRWRQSPFAHGCGGPGEITRPAWSDRAGGRSCMSPPAILRISRFRNNRRPPGRGPEVSRNRAKVPPSTPDILEQAHDWSWDGRSGLHGDECVAPAPAHTVAYGEAGGSGQRAGSAGRPEVRVGQVLGDR